jgi:hypothetical protein
MIPDESPSNRRNLIVVLWPSIAVLQSFKLKFVRNLTGRGRAAAGGNSVREAMVRSNAPLASSGWRASGAEICQY